MTFDVRVHSVVRAALLADWRARYLERGLDLDVSQDSDAWCWADATAFQLEGLEARALQLTRELFPHTATSAFLEEHAFVIGMSRKPATKARLRISVVGTGSWTTADRLVAPSTQQYAPTASASTPPNELLVEALVAGSAGNLAPGSTLSWTPTPTGLSTGATVLSVDAAAVDLERDEDFARRILAWWRERPGGGNRADWRAWGESRTGVAAAFVYPLLHGTLGSETPGAVTLCLLAPAPTAEDDAGEPLASVTRVVGAGVLSDVEDYLHGEGAYTADGGKCPAVVDPDDVFVVAVTPQPQDVDVEITLTDAYVFPWTTGPLAFTGGTTTQVTVATLPSGLVSGVLVAIPSSAIRGGYAYREVTVSGSGPYTLTFEEIAGASATGSILPLPLNAEEVRAAALAVFDALGPGRGAGGSARYPRPSAEAFPATLYRNSLVAALMGVPGVLDQAPVQGVEAVDVTLVGAVDPDLVEPAAKVLVTCGALRLLPA